MTRSAFLPTRAQKLLEGHSQAVNALAAVSPDGRIASGGADGQVIIFDTTTGTKVGTLTGALLGDHTQAVLCMAVLSSNRVCTGGADSLIILWSSAPSATAQPTQQLTKWPAHSGSVFGMTSVVGNPDWIVSGGEDFLVKVSTRCR